jgi:hypothetical protein
MIPSAIMNIIGDPSAPQSSSTRNRVRILRQLASMNEAMYSGSRKSGRRDQIHSDEWP